MYIKNPVIVAQTVQNRQKVISIEATLFTGTETFQSKMNLERSHTQWNLSELLIYNHKEQRYEDITILYSQPLLDTITEEALHGLVSQQIA
ncbi:hypothetical protein ACFSCX_06105 [Bacillus salitolerans]|uniref:Uncharacterized protein n=1 Tax=Bacillus salitolerans TaxID=1437434 RepID=A0ABW4LN02_9BACI